MGRSAPTISTGSSGQFDYHRRIIHCGAKAPPGYHLSSTRPTLEAKINVIGDSPNTPNRGGTTRSLGEGTRLRARPGFVAGCKTSYMGSWQSVVGLVVLQARDIQLKMQGWRDGFEKRPHCPLDVGSLVAHCMQQDEHAKVLGESGATAG